jgi:DNA-binding NarL/FixJ family response regulator
MDLNAPAKHILLIDDDQEIAGLIEEELTERAYRVTVATCSRDGFAVMQQDPPDLVLCDISMPGDSGLHLLQHLTPLTPRHINMPFLFLTALTDRETELRAWELGADDYVTKPVDFDILMAVIEARLAGVARRRSRSDQVCLNPRETEVLTWAARGKTSAEIAEIVDIAKRTVDFHADNAKVKLNAATRLHAVVKAATCGLIEI